MAGLEALEDITFAPRLERWIHVVLCTLHVVKVRVQLCNYSVYTNIVSDAGEICRQVRGMAGLEAGLFSSLLISSPELSDTQSP